MTNILKKKLEEISDLILTHPGVDQLEKYNEYCLWLSDIIKDPAYADNELEIVITYILLKRWAKGDINPQLEELAKKHEYTPKPLDNIKHYLHKDGSVTSMATNDNGELSMMTLSEKAINGLKGIKGVKFRSR